MSTIYQTNPITKRRRSGREYNYAYAKRVLSRVYNFSFKQKKHFTPHQKSQITRVLKRYGYILNAEFDGKGQFIKATPAQLRHLKKHHRDYTNKGVFIYEMQSQKVGLLSKYKIITIRKGKNKGKKRRLLKSVQLTTERKSRYELFVAKPDGLDMLTFIDLIIEIYNPDEWSSAVGGRKGRDTHAPEKYTRYLREAQRAFAERDTEDLYTGVYLIYFTKRKYEQAKKIDFSGT